MPTFIQKLTLAWRGWNRRRAEESKKRDAEALARNVTWGKPMAPAPSSPASIPAPVPRSMTVQPDLEGLQVAFLDDSGQLACFLDLATGEVIEYHTGCVPPEIAEAPRRYRPVPRRSAESDAEDRRLFVETLEPSTSRDHLAAAVHDPAAFRNALSADRRAERRWYNFKNDRATAAIQAWL
jgi:hypothetical protein